MPLETIICKKCEKPFERKSDLTKLLCPACVRRLKNEREAEELKSNGARANSEIMRSVERMSRAQAAELLRTTYQNVQKFERRALAKIRSHPELLKLWAECKAEGMPAQVDPSEKLLDYELEIARLWDFYENLRGINCSKEALECLAEIRRCYRALTKQIRTNQP